MSSTAIASDPQGSSGGGGRASRRNNLIAYCLQSGSSRVLNCLRITAELGGASGRDGPPKLLFKTAALNKSVIFKDLTNVETSFGAGRKLRAGTKVYLPFNHQRPAEGGQTFFFEGRTFTRLMASVVDLSDSAKRDALTSDAAVLHQLDALPAFAPFLLRDRFKQAEIDVDPLYVAIPEEEWDEIQAFIRERFRQILSAVDGSTNLERKRDWLNRLIDKLWDMNDVPALEELAAAFGLPRDGCLERFYAWKGTLYFCWAFDALQRDVFEIGSWLNDWPRLISAYPPNLQPRASSRFNMLHSELFKELRAVEMILSEYDRAFNDLFVHGVGPQRFINFLSDAPSKFNECGTGIGMLQHAHEVWDRLTESFPKRQANSEVLDEVINGITSVLGQTL